MALSEEEDATWWLDRETGKLISVSRETWEQAAQFGEDDESRGFFGRDAAIAEQIRAHPERYEKIPLPLEQEVADARAFISTVLSSVVQRRLNGVLDGPRPMDRFRATLARYPEELARWQAYRAAKLKTRIQEWGHGQGFQRA
jgi:hypothetical protein